MGSSTKLLSEYIKTVKSPHTKRKLWAFDFDDTLVKTDACTHVTSASGNKFDLTPAEFAVYERRPGDVFDYTDFEKLINPRAIRWMNRILHNVYAHHGANAVVIVSARSSPAPINEYMASINLGDVEVATMDTPDPAAKANWIGGRIERDGFEVVEFWDDSHKNVAAVNALRHRYPNVEIIARHVIHNRVSRSLSHQ